MLPMIGILTTAGTGSDAQSYGIISDPDDPREDGLRRSGRAFPDRPA
jgi:alcohol dehydrogenase class IV